MKKMGFNNKTERNLYYAFIIIFIILSGMLVYTLLKPNPMELRNEKISVTTFSGPAKTAKEYYEMLTCPCCGQTIDADCCGMAKERMKFINETLSDDVTNMDVLMAYSKKFGIESFDDSTQAQIKDYIRESAGKNPPEITMDNDRINLGTISQADGKVYAQFKITNSGKSDLIIDNMETSCMCTTASIIYDGQEGPGFGMSMHGENPTDYSVSIKTGDSAILKVEYDPNAHGPQKDSTPQKIIRYITLMSNDPDNFQQKVRIELTQVP